MADQENEEKGEGVERGEEGVGRGRGGSQSRGASYNRESRFPYLCLRLAVKLTVLANGDSQKSIRTILLCTQTPYTLPTLASRPGGYISFRPFHQRRLLP